MAQSHGRPASSARTRSTSWPSTITTGARPASTARRAARRTSDSPSSSSNILLRPMRREAPAASTMPATRGAGARAGSLRGGMDRRLALAQRVHAAARAHGQDLRDDGQRDLLRPVGPDVEAHGAVDPRCVALAEGGGGAQDLEHPLGALARSQHPDVGDRSPDEGPQVALVVREVVGHDDGVAVGVERQALEQLLGATLDQRRRRRKTLRREVGGTPVHHHDAEPDVRREARQGPGVVTGAADHELGRRDEHVAEDRSADDLHNPRLLGAEQFPGTRDRSAIQRRGSQVAFDRVAGDDEPLPSPFPFPRPYHRTRDEGGPAVEQLPFPRSLFEHRLDENVHLPLASDAQVPSRDLVAARAVALELLRHRPAHLERHLAHVQLVAPQAHVADRAPVLGYEQLCALVAVGRAAHAYHGRERSTPTRPVELREAIEDGPGFVPVLHAKEIYLGCWWERCATRSANCCQNVSVSFLAVPVSSRAPTLATVPRISDIALHLKRQRFGATGSISRSVLTSTADPGALPRAASLSRCGGRTSVSSTSSWNLSFTLPTPNADTTLK